MKLVRKFMYEVTAPLSNLADRMGCHIELGIAKGVADALRYERERKQKLKRAVTLAFPIVTEANLSPTQGDVLAKTETLESGVRKTFAFRVMRKARVIGLDASTSTGITVVVAKLGHDRLLSSNELPLSMWQQYFAPFEMGPGDELIVELRWQSEDGHP